MRPRGNNLPRLGVHHSPQTPTQAPNQMKNYLILYCAYAPDDYMGHRKLSHQAGSLEEAEAHARKVMAARIDGRPYEYPRL